MAQCSRCRAETELYHRGESICPSCVDVLEGKPAAEQRRARGSLEASARPSSGGYSSDILKSAVLGGEPPLVGSTRKTESLGSSTEP